MKKLNKISKIYEKFGKINSIEKKIQILCKMLKF
jgi:hypothetical protein